LRDHEAIVIEEFNGLWANGDEDSVPPDHFSEATNIQYFAGGFETRDGIDLYQSIGTALGNVLRIHPYKMTTGLTLLVLDNTGHIHHVVSPTVIHLNILTIASMTDFNCVSWAGRAYITPFFTDSNGTEKGINLEFLYVYLGAGVAARKAAGPTPAGTVTVANGIAGLMDFGDHIFGVVGETDTGYLSPPVALNSFQVQPNNTVSFSTVPVFVGAFWTKRHIVASIKIPNFNGDLQNYQLFFIPGATINDNVTTILNNVQFFDADLVDDASHLSENFSEIPAGVGLCTYHGRLVLTTTFNDISIAYVSEPGEPEAFNQIDGVLIVPLDGNPLTNCQEYRDVLYLFKLTRTVGYSDNQDVPSTWKMFVVDEATGCPVHGVASVLDSGGVNVDFLIIGDLNGLVLFDGGYKKPTLTEKVRDFWFALDRTQFRELEIVNNTIAERLYTVLPDGTMLYGDYEEGLDSQSIKWAHWTFQMHVRTVEVIDIDQVVIGSTDT
jgi:hypothetical protein